MKTDIEIAQSAKMKHIKDIAKNLNITEDDLEYYGKYKAKLSNELWEKLKNKKDGKLILVTAINPTPAGEGKTTTTIGLGDALSLLKKNVVLALREPSLGPVMGVKGGAAGGGYAQVVPMEDINLHFTGDMHAITAAHNLLSAMIDNHIKQGNELDIDPTKITFKRVLDINDRSLRNIVIGLGGTINGQPREDGFMITVASEIMAILCLSENLMDLKNRLSNIIIGFTKDDKPIMAKDLKAEGAMTLLLKDALKPNLIQTLENTPCIMHGGPFANIAHGCNSIKATKMALKLGDYVITEAGFGADLGAEKFLDIKCRKGNLSPDTIVIVATIRALKYNGGIKKEDLSKEDLNALKNGICNLDKHIENMKKYGVPVIVNINKFATDTDDEINFVVNHCFKQNIKVAVSSVFADGGKGGLDLAKLVIEETEKEKNFTLLYDENLSIKEKIQTIVKEIYGGKDVSFTPLANKKIKQLEELGLDKKPICIAKTQYSLSDDEKLLGRPNDFIVTIKDVNISNGAGFIVVLAGNIMTMPGLPKIPAATKIDIDENGVITGLF